ncbi:MAG: coenzyme F420-0:L-glutamate ligase [Bacillota bacterium]|nr:coenzyme F420-0:L-glutamate ligase [Bacillota bacterium]
MSTLPDYLGPMAFGLKMGVILPGMDIVEKVYERLISCYKDGLLENGDVICITESVVARAQNNYITIDDIAREIREVLQLSDDSRIAVVYPIASRNRFSMILKGIARAVSRGEVIVQFSYPADEVGNQIISAEYLSSFEKEHFHHEDFGTKIFKHPVTGVDYINLYRQIIEEEGAKASVILSNDPLYALEFEPHGIIAADIHSRNKTLKTITDWFENCITLDQVCNEGEACSEWGLLGSNMSAGERLKLAPRDGRKIVNKLQTLIKEKMDLEVEVMIYGDGAYLDPSSGIYELADPKAAFAATDGLDCFREGLKYKYLADHCYHEEQRSADEIESILSSNIGRKLPEDSLEKEGTTPRRMEDVLASLADLVSGSADAGTPVVVIKGFLK